MLKRPKTIPTHPGVYIFWCQKTPLYVGKALNLKKRVSSYFKKNAPWKVTQLCTESTRIEFRKAESEIEALITESELIKKYRPKYNILMRDDKNYLYVSITKDEFPRFYFTHQPERDSTTVGPFVEAVAIKEAMRMLRNAFPFCTCKRSHRGTCVNSQIGRCKGYCCIKERVATPGERTEYQKNIRTILSLLSGGRNAAIKELVSEMKEASKLHEYERAAKTRDQIYALESMYRHRGIAVKRRGETPWYKIENVLKSIFNTKEPIRRVEGYDISNISGTESTGSMIVFYDGRPDKSQYRKFKVKSIEGANDVGSHREVIKRRFLHEEWEFPQLVLIDGGKPQLNAILPLLNRKVFKGVHIAALSKPPKRYFSRAPSGPGQAEDLLYVPNRALAIPVKSLPPQVMHFLQRVRDESHRFAKAYHSVLRKKLFQSAK